VRSEICLRRVIGTPQLSLFVASMSSRSSPVFVSLFFLGWAVPVSHSPEEVIHYIATTWSSCNNVKRAEGKRQLPATSEGKEACGAC